MRVIFLISLLTLLTCGGTFAGPACPNSPGLSPQDRAEFCAIATADQNFTFTRYIQLKPLCFEFRAYAMGFMKMHILGVKREEAMRQATQISAKKAIGADPLSALLYEKMILSLVNTIYNSAYLEMDAFADHAYHSCMNRKPL